MSIQVPQSLTGFDAVEDWLLSFEAEAMLACYVALYESVDDVEQAAKDTTSYNDDTTATRNSTMAYVVAPSQGEVPEVPFVSVETANQYRPYSASDDSHPSLEEIPEHAIVLDVMSATDYSHFLNTRNANEGAYLELAILDNYQAIMDRIVDKVRGVMF